MYHLLDWIFVVLHTSVTLFNLFGWIWQRTRKWNLVLLLITGFFWFGVGAFYGFGYCPLTDWHFQVLYKLGNDPETNSYIAYLVSRFFNLHVATHTVDVIVLLCFLGALVLSVSLNIRDRKKFKIQKIKINNE